MSADPYPFNQLTPAEAERLALLIEECGEVIQAACKILRHGYESRHPTTLIHNRADLEKELGDLQAALLLLVRADDIDFEHVEMFRDDKIANVRRYLHHQG